MTKKGLRDSRDRRKKRLDLFQLQQGKCFWCSRDLTLENGSPLPENYATLDELVPRGRGGTRRLLNIVVSCMPCNHWRGDSLAPGWAFERVAEREANRGKVT
jgi:5-methylcytosine-specific restriction endonuclease McrA